MRDKNPLVAGEPMDFDIIYNRYKEATMRRALRVLDNNYHDAEDAMQDAWSYIAKEAGRLSFDTEAMLSAYIMLTIEGRARAVRDKRLRRRTVPLPTYEDDFEDADCNDPVLYQLCATEAVEDIRRAIEKMKPIYREVLILALLYEFPAASIAKTLNIKETTAHMRLKRGKAALAAALRKEKKHDESGSWT